MKKFRNLHCKGKDEKTMKNAKSNLEIERKFLINMVKPEGIRKYVQGILKEIQIEQIYLVAKEGERRIRKQTVDGISCYYYTEKITITELKRREKERELTKNEYEDYKKEADVALRPIQKIRYVFEYKGQVIEIDIYEYSSDKAILEIELPNEEKQVDLPDFISVIKEVTYDKAYKNHSLAKTQTL